MGTTWPAGFSESASIEVQASVDTVWSTLADIQAFPEIFSHVESVDIIESKCGNNSRSVVNSINRSNSEETLKQRELQNGVCWNETRKYNGHTVTYQKCITSVTAYAPGTNNTTQESEETIEATTSNTLEQRCVRINVTLPSTPKYSGLFNTYTWIVESSLPSDGTNPSCRLFSSMAFLPKRSFMFVTICCCFLKGRNINIVNEKVKEMLSREVNEIAVEAERRQVNQHSSISDQK
jgi:Polyketide cyclase / dehydrase and lipid transport